MNSGWIVLGASTTLAVAAAVGLVVAAPSATPIHGPTIGVCGSPAKAASARSHSMAASFVIWNTSGSPVTILGLRPATRVGLESARVTLAPGGDIGDASFYRVGASVGVPADEVAKSSAVTTDRSATIAAHSASTVITSMTLADGATAGRAADFQLATAGPLGTIRTQTIHASVGLGIDSSACSALLG